MSVWNLGSMKVGERRDFVEPYTGEDRNWPTPETPEDCFRRIYKNTNQQSVIREIQLAKNKHNEFTLVVNIPVQFPMMIKKILASGYIADQLRKSIDEGLESCENFMNQGGKIDPDIWQSIVLKTIDKKDLDKFLKFLELLNGLEEISPPEILNEMKTLIRLAIFGEKKFKEEEDKNKRDQREQHVALKAVNKMLILSSQKVKEKRQNRKYIRSDYPDKPWLDIPNRKDLKELVELQDSQVELKKLMSLLGRYHNLNKTEKRNLPARIRLLDEIENIIRDIRETLKLSKAASDELFSLQKSARGKGDYLEALMDRALDSYSSITQTFGGFTKSGALLRVQRSYGQAEIRVEHFDPCYRSGKDFQELIERWQAERAVSKEKNFPSFYLWLEDKDNITSNLSFAASGLSDSIRNFSKLFRLRETRIENGIIHTVAGEPLKPLSIESISGKEQAVEKQFIYAVSPDNKLFLASQESGIGNHPYIIGAGQPVLCAGNLRISNGKIVYIDNGSGHYQPTPYHLNQVLELFKKQGCFTDDAVVQVVDGISYNAPIPVREFDARNVSYKHKIGDRMMTPKEISSEFGPKDKDKPSR